MVSAVQFYTCPLCLVKLSEPGEAPRIAHNRQMHPDVKSWRGPGPKGRKGAQPPKVGKGRAFPFKRSNLVNE